MKYLSIFSGIEAFSVAVEGLDFEPVGFAEIDPFASAVLAHRFPEVKNFGDVRNIHADTLGLGQGELDLLVGGSPCQSFSIAGNREGLDGASGLVVEYLRILDELRPRWFIWENVPGVLSIDGGRTFGSILRKMGQLRYCVAYRILDAQYWGVPQRRRRVFVVGRLGEDWRRPAEVLFEREGVPRNTAKGGESGKGTAGGAKGGSGKASHWDGDYPHPTLTQCNGKSGGIGASNQEVFSQRGGGLVPIDLRHATKGPTKEGGVGVGEEGDPSFTVTSSLVHGVADCRKRERERERGMACPNSPDAVRDVRKEAGTGEPTCEPRVPAFCPDKAKCLTTKVYMDGSVETFIVT